MDWGRVATSVAQSIWLMLASYVLANIIVFSVSFLLGVPISLEHWRTILAVDILFVGISVFIGEIAKARREAKARNPSFDPAAAFSLAVGCIAPLGVHTAQFFLSNSDAASASLAGYLVDRWLYRSAVDPDVAYLLLSGTLLVLLVLVSTRAAMKLASGTDGQSAFPLALCLFVVNALFALPWVIQQTATSSHALWVTTVAVLGPFAVFYFLLLQSARAIRPFLKATIGVGDNRRVGSILPFAASSFGGLVIGLLVAAAAVYGLQALAYSRQISPVARNFLDFLLGAGVSALAQVLPAAAVAFAFLFSIVCLSFIILVAREAAEFLAASLQKIGGSWSPAASIIVARAVTTIVAVSAILFIGWSIVGPAVRWASSLWDSATTQSENNAEAPSASNSKDLTFRRASIKCLELGVEKVWSYGESARVAFPVATCRLAEPSSPEVLVSVGVASAEGRSESAEDLGRDRALALLRALVQPLGSNWTGQAFALNLGRRIGPPTSTGEAATNAPDRPVDALVAAAPAGDATLVRSGTLAKLREFTIAERFQERYERCDLYAVEFKDGVPQVQAPLEFNCAEVQR